eukprot:CAMPEP_0167798760 /NCGR_PEP_ID=MMETSP0111_2-20121227/16543_1 /TAXON_ID=91324 /ORGANISM="Lotharella globosa, Strain CCCM811" /LENGTH=37 /DNA_ID= /DNA_START= /DNA_END= /DNA_ORIENTATION=
MALHSGGHQAACVGNEVETGYAMWLLRPPSSLPAVSR